MPKNQFVVELPSLTGSLYLTGYNVGNPPEITFGNLVDAVIYTSLGDAETAANAIGGGTRPTEKPNNP